MTASASPNPNLVSTPAPAATPSPAAVALPPNYTLHAGYPPIPAYLHLRAASGLTPKSPAQAAPVATGSWYGCYITFTPDTATTNDNNNNDNKTEIVAMGRIISDGGWYFHIADMAVLPAHQRKGLGKVVLRDLLWRIKEYAPKDGDGECYGAYVTLFADGPGRRLYEKTGFVQAAGMGQVGMSLPMGWEGGWE